MPNPDPAKQLRAAMGIPDSRPVIMASIVRIRMDAKTVYGCFAGGTLRDGEAWLTLAGLAVASALMNLPCGDDTHLIMQELKDGSKSYYDKVIDAIERAHDGAKICFFGNMQGGLDRFVAKLIGTSPPPLAIADLATRQ